MSQGAWAKLPNVRGPFVIKWAGKGDVNCTHRNQRHHPSLQLSIRMVASAPLSPCVWSFPQLHPSLHYIHT